MVLKITNVLDCDTFLDYLPNNFFHPVFFSFTLYSFFSLDLFQMLGFFSSLSFFLHYFLGNCFNFAFQLFCYFFIGGIIVFISRSNFFLSDYSIFHSIHLLPYGHKPFLVFLRVLVRTLLSFSFCIVS